MFFFLFLCSGIPDLALGILKLLSTDFYEISVFSPNDSPSKTEKCFLFHLKSSFYSQDFFNFSSSFPHFPDSKGQLKVE